MLTDITLIVLFWIGVLLVLYTYLGYGFVGGGRWVGHLEAVSCCVTQDQAGLLETPEDGVGRLPAEGGGLGDQLREASLAP